MSLLADDLETRRKRLRFQAWHRGTREMDLLLGRFVDSCIAGLDKAELGELETLFNWPDPDLFAWIMGQADIPTTAETPILRRIIAFHNPEGEQLPD
jgi:antitoxin CptB